MHAAATGGAGQSNGHVLSIDLVEKRHQAIDSFETARGVFKKRFLPFPEIAELLFRKVTEEVAENVLAFVSFKNEIQIVVANLFSKRTEKCFPSLLVNGMAVDDNAI
jgi:hypothetical protein